MIYNKYLSVVPFVLLSLDPKEVNTEKLPVDQSDINSSNFRKKIKSDKIQENLFFEEDLEL